MLVLISFTQKYSWVDFGKYAFRTHTYTQNKLQLRSFLLPSDLPLDLGAGCGSEEAASSQHRALLLSPLCRLVRTLNSLEEISFSSKLSFRKTQIPTRMKITKWLFKNSRYFLNLVPKTMGINVKEDVRCSCLMFGDAEASSSAVMFPENFWVAPALAFRF